MTSYSIPSQNSPKLPRTIKCFLLLAFAKLVWKMHFHWTRSTSLYMGQHMDAPISIRLHQSWCFKNLWAKFCPGCLLIYWLHEYQISLSSWVTSDLTFSRHYIVSSGYASHKMEPLITRSGPWITRRKDATRIQSITSVSGVVEWLLLGTVPLSFYNDLSQGYKPWQTLIYFRYVHFATSHLCFLHSTEQSKKISTVQPTICVIRGFSNAMACRRCPWSQIFS